MQLNNNTFLDGHFIAQISALSTTKQVVVKASVAVLTLGLPTGIIWHQSDVCAAAMLFIIVDVGTSLLNMKNNGLRKFVINAAIVAGCVRKRDALFEILGLTSLI